MDAYVSCREYRNDHLSEIFIIINQSILRFKDYLPLYFSLTFPDIFYR